LLLCIPSGTLAANLHRPPVFSLVRDDPSVRRITILSPYSSETGFVQEFEHPKVDFGCLTPGVPGWLERRFIRVMQVKFVKTMPSESMRIRLARVALIERESRREERYLDRGERGGTMGLAKSIAMKTLTSLRI